MIRRVPSWTPGRGVAESSAGWDVSVKRSSGEREGRHAAREHPPQTPSGGWGARSCRLPPCCRVALQSRKTYPRAAVGPYRKSRGTCNMKATQRMATALTQSPTAALWGANSWTLARRSSRRSSRCAAAGGTLSCWATGVCPRPQRPTAAGDTSALNSTRASPARGSPWLAIRRTSGGRR